MSPIPVTGVATGYPVRRIYCVGRNYVEHIREMKEGDERDAPFFFQKPADAVVGDGATVRYPQATNDFHYEGELVLAIGQTGQDVPAESAVDHIFGFAVGIDLTRRDLQRQLASAGRPWEAGKSFDQSAPVGELTRLGDLSVLPIKQGGLTLHVNDEVRQQCTFDQMIWKVPEIVANLSRQYRLEFGDLVYTGTPAGVGPLHPGDRVRVQATGLNDLTITIA